MKSYLCRHGLLLWHEIRGRRAFPDHTDLDPYRLAPVLASRFILDIGADTIRSVETGTRVLARLPQFARAPQEAFAGLDGEAFATLARIVADEKHGAVIIAKAESITLELLLMPLTFQRLSGRRVFGVMADCNPYAKHGASPLLKIESCRFLSKEFLDLSPHDSYLSATKNQTLTAIPHSEPRCFATAPQKLMPKFNSRLLQ